MQETRQHILEILKEVGEATVNDIVAVLRERRGDKITAVTVRHHLNELQQRELIDTSQLRHRSTPGRPQHIYVLTEKALEHFPDNYQRLATGLLERLQSHLPPEGVNVIIEGVADDMAADIDLSGLPFKQRIKRVIEYLNEHGYSATYEPCEDGYILRTNSCPYHELASQTDHLCRMDMRLISSLLGVVPRILSRVAEGGSNCAYLIPTEKVE
jgi:predicted ArsR family transcriptional regulator